MGLLLPVRVVGGSIGKDARSALSAVRILGARVQTGRQGLRIWPGASPTGESRIHAGNSGTTARFCLGWAAGGKEPVWVEGDKSLLSRKVGRLNEDIRHWGGQAGGTKGCFPAFACGPVQGPFRASIIPGSGTRKGALLLAAVRSGASISWKEDPLSRDHTERLFAAAGCWPRVEGSRSEPYWAEIPPDPSAFAVLATAAAMIPRSKIGGKVLTNLRRTGLLRFLGKAGITVKHNREEVWPELVGRVQVEHPGELPQGDLIVEGQDLMDMIDEVPLAAVFATTRRGTTRFRTGGLLRNKESDRLEGTADLITTLGGNALIEGEDLVVKGSPGSLKGGKVDTRADHRLVLAAAVAGIGSDEGVDLSENEWGGIAFPGWQEALEGVGVLFS